MNSINALIDRFIYTGDRETPDKYRKGRFFLIAMFIMFFLSVISAPYYFSFTTNMDKMMIGMYSFTLLVQAAILFIYPRFGYRILMANIYFAISGLISWYFTYQLNGGIYSPDLSFATAVTIFIFLITNKISGILWSIAHLIVGGFYYYAEVNGWQDFHSVAFNMPADYYFLSIGSSVVFATVIILLHESMKDKFLADLNTSKAEVEQQKKQLEVQKEDIISSLNYAKRIQYAVLPQEDSIYRNIPLSFILYKPRDIVSGDFFWFHELDRDNYIIVCADCTGHGVPGALMTVIGSNLLTQIVVENKLHTPQEILSELDRRISFTLKQEKRKEDFVHDGMDLSLLKVNKAEKYFQYTSAKRPIIFIRDNQLNEFKGSRHTLGGLRSGEKEFEEIRMEFREDDMIYLFTDGYIDQFGGPENKKFMIRRFREMLLRIHKKPMPEQKQHMEKEITEWMRNNEQTDDITVLGIRF